ncbi:hypothetical protein GALMADRAFT_249214 [Galerina marginata CBS 339.88]|uniref:Cyclin N-terminal domain-containing protein n=1 Tax=Galerina marginata (strain CBS 339.88) TaxID=685588 RepID=A0A067SWA4_GALM3|nr:hypothetical protein GALMADRAFT_249214 [Galerina marginata CBS 339.88]
MHATAQLIAQRAPPATRAKARWQPYYANSSASSSTSLPTRSPFLHTPHASVSSPPSSQISSCDLNRIRQPLPTPTAQTPKDLPPRDPTKHKFAAGLIDQAVNTLSEIWRPQDIPREFQAPPKAATSPSTSQSHIPSHPKQHNGISRSTPVPSLSTQPPPTPISVQITENISVTSQAILAAGTDVDQNLLPIKTFVHEVLRRSRTSGSILQAALCYLEAIRPKVSELLRQENMGVRAHYQPDSRIQPATPEELEREAELCAMEESSQTFDDSMKTIRVTDCGPEELEMSAESDRASISSLIAEPSVTSKPSSTPSLPSPLLCPRRAFLASLILASKFFQDKCYSNRAWSKVSGLPPREIGRCERALGQALEWRLWVGKTPVSLQSTTPAATPIRTVVRSQSEGSLLSTSSSSKPFLAQDESRPIPQDLASGKRVNAPSLKTGLRRASTLPDGAFAAQLGGPRQSVPVIAVDIDQDQDMQIAFNDPKQEQEIAMDSTGSTYAPSPETPGLTYSPSSTESSSGDSTIQMSTLEDNMFPSANASQLWLEQVDPRCGAFKSASPAPFEGSYRYDGSNFLLDLARYSKGNHVAVIQSEPGSCAPHYLWHEDNHHISLEATGVH